MELSLSSSNRWIKIEVFLRFLAFLTLFLAALVLGTDEQIKVYFGAYKKKANFKVACILKVSIYIYSVGAGYSLLHLVRCLAFPNYHGEKLWWSNHILRWIYFILDQVAVYVVLAITCASIEMGLLAITGNDDFEWMKLCNKFGRFCSQYGGFVACGSMASFVLAVISNVSTFNLFRWYSPNFLCLKPNKIGVVSTPSTNN